MAAEFPREDLFWAKVQKTDECWLWTGATNGVGYGKLGRKRQFYQAHHVSLLLAGRPVPPGMCADHLCRTPACVNPDHLEIVTFAENVRRGDKSFRNKTHCQHGHSLTSANVMTRRNGRQRCRVCHNEHVKLSLRAKRQRARSEGVPVETGRP